MGYLSEWRPFTQLGRARPSIFDELFRDTFRDYLAPGGETPALRFMPRANINETPEAYELEVEVPGVRPDDVRVTFTGDTLMIQGEKRREEQAEDDTWHVTERAFGVFQRSFTFPTPVDADSVEATSEHGVLKLRVTKAREAQPKRIAVRAGKGEKGAKREIKTSAKPSEEEGT